MKLSTTIFLILFAQRFIVPVLAQTISYDPASPRQSYAVARNARSPNCCRPKNRQIK
ncbi:MAG: hypothetical protein WBB35_17545 [Saprospiraceae bacterium]